MGNFFGGKDRSRSRNAANNAQFQDFSLAGPGGSNASYDPETGRIRLGAGDLGALRNTLLSSSMSRLLGGASLPSYLTGSAAGSLADLAAPDFSQFQFNAPTFTIPGNSPTANILQNAALSNLDIANADPFSLAQDRLGLLRQQAQPFEDRAFSTLQDTLFKQGRLGSTGGALQTEAFARGLGQADLQRQLDSADFARGLQQDAAGRLSSFLGLGEALNQSDFARALSGFGANLQASQGAFDRNLGVASMSADARAQNAMNRFNLATALFGTGQSAEQQRFAQALQGVSGVQGIDQGLLQQFASALAAEQGRSNASLGVADTFNELAKNSTGAQFGQFFNDIATGIGSIIPG